jgi:hypothetical protein
MISSSGVGRAIWQAVLRLLHGFPQKSEADASSRLFDRLVRELAAGIARLSEALMETAVRMPLITPTNSKVSATPSFNRFALRLMASVYRIRRSSLGTLPQNRRTDMVKRHGRQVRQEARANAQGRGIPVDAGKNEPLRVGEHRRRDPTSRPGAIGDHLCEPGRRSVYDRSSVTITDEVACATGARHVERIRCPGAEV